MPSSSDNCNRWESSDPPIIGVIEIAKKVEVNGSSHGNLMGYWLGFITCSNQQYIYIHVYIYIYISVYINIYIYMEFAYFLGEKKRQVTKDAIIGAPSPWFITAHGTKAQACQRMKKVMPQSVISFRFWPIPMSSISEVYPLVNLQKAIENGHRNNGFTH